MKRRALLTSGAGAAAAAWALAGHWPALAAFADRREARAGGGSLAEQFADLNPDRMWPVYRRYYLLIVCQRDDERSGAFTAAVVDVLSRHLPGSRPQLVIGVLIATDQQDVAVMQAASAEALFPGTADETALRHRAHRRPLERAGSRGFS